MGFSWFADLPLGATLLVPVETAPKSADAQSARYFGHIIYHALLPFQLPFLSWCRSRGSPPPLHGHGCRCHQEHEQPDSAVGNCLPPQILEIPGNSHITGRVGHFE